MPSEACEIKTNFSISIATFTCRGSPRDIYQHLHMGFCHTNKIQFQKSYKLYMNRR